MEDPISTTLGLVAVVLLVLANGFFVATEFALVSVRRTRIQQLDAEGVSKAKSVLDLLGHLDTYIAATQLGITISSLALGWIGEPAVASLLHSLLAKTPIEVGSRTSHAISFIIAFSFVTAMHIVIGELAPKSLALQRPEQTSLAVAGPIHAFYVVFRPVIFALNWIGNEVVRLVGIEPASGHELVQSTEELMLSIDASHEAGLVNQTAHDIVDRAFIFTDLQARHVMVPRTEITAIPVDATLEDVIDIVASSSFTRIPVYEGDADNMIGVVKAKRLLPVFLQQLRDRQAALARGESVSPQVPFDIRDYLYEPQVVPETIPATEVLTLMRESHSQMAIVIDEYGGTAGIVTLKDIVTQLVGRVQDEEDVPELSGPDTNGVLYLDGLMNLTELREAHMIDLQSEGFDVETLGGYVFAALGRPGIVGDEVESRDGVTFRVEAMDGLRVSRLSVQSQVSQGV
ncbi:MAG TPA: hemolysin family protein [Thermomicrobiales bacterium]|nr:hemolysin family protein [Thermomicrobiales bacterium]